MDKNRDEAEVGNVEKVRPSIGMEVVMHTTYFAISRLAGQANRVGERGYRPMC
jgi:hypothetical protein